MNRQRGSRTHTAMQVKYGCRHSGVSALSAVRSTEVVRISGIAYVLKSIGGRQLLREVALHSDDVQ